MTAGHAYVTDLGRPGHATVGVAANGAADAFAARLASTLVGNAPGAPVVEVTGSAFAVVADGPVLLAVAGAVAEVRLAGEAQPASALLVVPAGVVCAVPAPVGGWRSYVAVNGRLDVPQLLGSVAPDGLLGFGRRLAAGDALTLDSEFGGLAHPVFGQPVLRLAAPRPAASAVPVVDVTTGPERAGLTGGLEGEFEVTPASDAVGLRLTGRAPRRLVPGELLSRGVPVGAIEVPPGGGLLALLRGRLVTAGYPVVAVATSVGVDRLAQLRPGDRTRFREVSLDAALAAVRDREAGRRALERRVRTAFGAVGLGGCLPASGTQPTGRTG